MSGLLPVDEAIQRILTGVEPLPAETVALGAANGRRLAERLTARRTQPPFPSSAMDGYAVRSADTARAPADLKVLGVSAAGHGFHGRVGPGEAVRIFTGAPVPEGADAILLQENAQPVDAASVRFSEPVSPGRHIRTRGLDFNEGDTFLDPNRRLGMLELALAAALGYAELPVRVRPRIAVIATGDELVPPGSPTGPDQIIASNSVGVVALAESIGAVAYDLGIVADDRRAIVAAVDRALAIPADIVVTLGGASVGDHDLVREALAGRDMALDFWRVAVRPGKPLVFGRLGRTLVLGLPGNPVSSLVGSILFLKPLVDALLGETYADPSEPAVLAADLPANDSRQDYLRATLSGVVGAPPLVAALPRQDSSLLSVLAAAGCLIIRPPFVPPAKAGDACRIIRLP